MQVSVQSQNHQLSLLSDLVAFFYWHSLPEDNYIWCVCEGRGGGILLLCSQKMFSVHVLELCDKCGKNGPNFYFQNNVSFSMNVQYLLFGVFSIYTSCKLFLCGFILE